MRRDPSACALSLPPCEDTTLCKAEPAPWAPQPRVPASRASRHTHRGLSPSAAPAAGARADQATRLSYTIMFPPLRDDFPSSTDRSMVPSSTMKALPSSLIFLQPPRSCSLLFFGKTIGTVCTCQLLSLLQRSLAPTQGRSHAHNVPTMCPHRQRTATLGSVLIPPWRWLKAAPLHLPRRAPSPLPARH